LRWFGHVEQMLISVPIRSNRITDNGAMRTRSSPEQTRMLAIKKDMIVVNLTKEMGLNGFELKRRFM